MATVEDVVPKEEEEKVAPPGGDGKAKAAEEELKAEIEPKTGISFPVKLDNGGKQLGATGLRKKSVLGLGIKIYAFGIYADTAKLKEILRSKFDGAPENPTKELYDIVIDSDVGMLVRLVIVFRGLTMSLVRKNFNDGLGASLKKLNDGQRDDELVNKVMGAATDGIKLPSGSIIEIKRFPGYTLQAEVKGEVVSKVESELLCRAYFHMYLGDEPFDKEAKEQFGKTLLSLL